MNKKSLVYPVLTIMGITIGGIGIFSYLRIKKILAGNIKIDSSEKMPSYIATPLHSAKILPIRIPMQTIINAVKGKGNVKIKAMESLKKLAENFSITLEEQ